MDGDLSALLSGGGSLESDNTAVQSLRTAIITTLAVTLLNPHFYLDTVVLFGDVSSQFSGGNRLFFWVGAVTASTLWFVCLSLGGRMLAPLFKKQISWRILDSLVCVTMWAISVSLITNEISS